MPYIAIGLSFVVAAILFTIRVFTDAEESKQAFYDLGRLHGHDVGYVEGHLAGWCELTSEQYDRGYLDGADNEVVRWTGIEEEARKVGYDDGYDAGYADAHIDNFDAGRTAGFRTALALTVG